MSIDHTRWIVLAAAVTAAACGSDEEVLSDHARTAAVTATTDYGDAVATSTYDETAGVIVTTLEDPEQTETLLILEWDVQDGTAVWYAPDGGEAAAIPADDIRLQQSPGLEQANQMAYEQWQLGEDAYWCYCDWWERECSGIWRCFQVPVCEEECHVTPDDYVCETKCHYEIECEWEEYCYWRCLWWTCDV